MFTNIANITKDNTIAIIVILLLVVILTTLRLRLLIVSADRTSPQPASAFTPAG